jgi:organic radical activating enzyme
MNLLSEFKNGSYQVTLFEDGTKIREQVGKENLIPYPETIDIKITDYCDMGCPWCHEKSTKAGVHGDLEELKNQLSWLEGLPIELAIGGGNPLSHPELTDFLMWASNKGFLCNLTVNEGHLIPFMSFLEDLVNTKLIRGLGISVNPKLNKDALVKISSLSTDLVLHFITGVHTYEQVKEVTDLLKFPKILFLGYKNFGFGEGYLLGNVSSIKDKIQKLKVRLVEFIKPSYILSFDNLALEQLEPQRFLWDPSVFYMGDEFTFSMYIDVVEQQSAPTSRYHKASRTNWKEKSLQSFWETK